MTRKSNKTATKASKANEPLFSAQKEIKSVEVEQKIVTKSPIVNKVVDQAVIDKVIDKKHIEVHKQDVVTEVHEQPIIGKFFKSDVLMI
jgi:hypothetical protein